MLTIRQIRPVDAVETAEMLRGIYAYFDSLEDGAAPEEILAAESMRDVADIVKLSLGPKRFCDCLIAEQDEAVVGYLAYHFGVFDSRPALFVAGLFVRPQARGEGVGGALMEEAERIARDEGAAVMVWTVWQRNLEAKAFYEHLGASVYDDDFIMWMPVGERD